MELGLIIVSGDNALVEIVVIAIGALSKCVYATTVWESDCIFIAVIKFNDVGNASEFAV